MKRILILTISFLLINNFAFAAGGDSGSSSKISTYDEAVKLIKRAGKLEKKDNKDKAVKLYKEAFNKLVSDNYDAAVVPLDKNLKETYIIDDRIIRKNASSPVATRNNLLKIAIYKKDVQRDELVD